jgi:hypothetical protein
MLVEGVENSVPRLEIAVSWLSNVVNWVFHGVSTFCKLATIEETVVLTSKPAPLVGDPKLSPTVPIVTSMRAWSSRRTTRCLARLENAQNLRSIFALGATPPHKRSNFLPAKQFIGYAGMGL